MEATVLEAAGHFERAPRKGSCIAQLSPGDIEDVYHWRQVLEDEAHRIAVPRMGKSDLLRMGEINDRICRAAESGDSSIADLNREFHFVAFERAGSEILLQLLNHLWDAAAPYQHAMAYATPPHAFLHAEHDDLLEAFEARNVTMVNARMTEHRRWTLRAIRKSWLRPTM